MKFATHNVYFSCNCCKVRRIHLSSEASWKESPVASSSEVSLWLSREGAVCPTSTDKGVMETRGAWWESREGMAAARYDMHIHIVSLFL